MSSVLGEERQMLCPVCRRPTRWEGNADRPFCSERCRLVDLGRWAAGEYAVAGEDSPVSSDER